MKGEASLNYCVQLVVRDFIRLITTNDDAIFAWMLNSCKMKITLIASQSLSPLKVPIR